MSVPISVVMSVYNSQAYLEEAARSILDQTFRDFEFIIINDGSTDGSQAILERLGKSDLRIRLISRENKGLPATLNEGIALAQGEFIARMDSDDIALPTRFEKQLSFMREHPEVTCLGSRVILIDPFGTEISTTDHPLTHDELDAMLLKGIGWAVVHPVAFLRKQAVLDVGGYNINYRTGQDMELWLRMAERGKLANLAEPLLKYRQHLESANFAKAEQQKRFKVQVMTDAYKRRGLPAFDPSILPPPPLTDPVQSRLRWGWRALKVGNPRAARSHAWANIKSRPTSMESWKLLLAGIRGR